ncbi:hypothetical protein GBL_1257 [Geobacillus kaustophilus GBlys]|uniref:Uncharacterized protein n=1 Tax=Geobacillus kaustophilus GBlys TaxID=1337888 RepID=U2X2X6_GEOKU|nr:hypothetical protein GBL_1257 [Geobacillus kaustophilus GBlys]
MFDGHIDTLLSLLQYLCRDVPTPSRVGFEAGVCGESLH